MEVKMHRRSGSMVRRAGKLSFVQDNGGYLPLRGTANGRYVFSESGIGVQPLALIGTSEKLYAWLNKNKHLKIVNTIPDLPKIYMGCGQYKPGSRFVGLFPLEAAAGDLIKGLAGFAMAFAGPSTTARGLADADLQMRDQAKFYDPNDSSGQITGSSAAAKKSKKQKYVITFSYIREDRMHHLATKSVKMGDVSKYLRRKYGRGRLAP